VSLRSIIRKARTFCTIKYQSDTVVAGGQLTKSWIIRHSNIPFRINEPARRHELLYYDKAKIFAQMIIYILAKTDIEQTDRIYFGTREFIIKKLDNWDEQNLYQRISVQEVTIE